MVKVGFIGAGKVGFTLGKYFATHNAEVTGYYSRNTQSAEEAAKFTDTEAFSTIKEVIDESDALFLTVPDGAITSVYEEVIRYPIVGKVICHSSGALSSAEAFPGIKEKGAYACSVHPLFAVSDRYNAYSELADVFFAVEGSSDALNEIKKLMECAGLSYQIIDPLMKETYHCAASVASNLAVGLIDMSAELLVKCGFEYEDALKALKSLAEGNLKHVFEDGPVRALTGPVERADAGTVSKHLTALCENEEEREIYRLLSKRLIKIASRKHSDRDFEVISELLK